MSSTTGQLRKAAVQVAKAHFEWLHADDRTRRDIKEMVLDLAKEIRKDVRKLNELELLRLAASMQMDAELLARKGAQSVQILNLQQSLLVHPVIINFLNLTFAPAFVGSQGGQVTAVTAAIVGVCMLTYLQYQLIMRSANMLITKLPDRIARWFGAAAEGLEEGHNTERDNTTIIGAVQGVSRQGSSALQPKLKRPSGPKAPKA